jgi:hypothetical protein
VAILRVETAVTTNRLKTSIPVAAVRFSARLAVAASLLFVGACDHLKMFEDGSQQSTARAPVRKPVTARRSQTAGPQGAAAQSQTAALRGTTSGEESPAQTEPASPGIDAAKASKLRAQALEQMNRGAIDEAVVNLRKAAMLDPSNTLIKRDLDRAIRIQTTVQSRPS